MSPRALTAGLLAATAVLAFAGAWPWLAARDAAALPPAPSPALAAEPPGLPPLAGFAETLARPLFAADRRPAAPTAPAAVRPALTARLEGVILAGTARHALIREEGQVRRVAEGDAVGGWVVRRIERDRVVLGSGDEEIVLQREAKPR